MSGQEPPPDSSTSPPTAGSGSDTPGGKPKRAKKPHLSPDERSARSALILQAKLANKRIQEIQAEFRLSRASVYRAIDEAKKRGFLEQARDFLTINLVPLALHAYEEALLFGDIPTKVDVANRLLDGLGITGKHATLHVESDKQESFEEFRAHVIRKVITTGPPTPAAAERGDVVEAESVEPAQASAASRGTADGEGSLPGPAGSGGVDN